MIEIDFDRHKISDRVLLALSESRTGLGMLSLYNACGARDAGQRILVSRRVKEMQRFGDLLLQGFETYLLKPGTKLPTELAVPAEALREPDEPSPSLPDEPGLEERAPAAEHVQPPVRVVASEPEPELPPASPMLWEPETLHSTNGVSRSDANGSMPDARPLERPSADLPPVAKKTTIPRTRRGPKPPVAPPPVVTKPKAVSKPSKPSRRTTPRAKPTPASVSVLKTPDTDIFGQWQRELLADCAQLAERRDVIQRTIATLTREIRQANKLLKGFRTENRSTKNLLAGLNRAIDRLQELRDAVTRTR